jgi:hypothetical protein
MMKRDFLILRTTRWLPFQQVVRGAPAPIKSFYGSMDVYRDTGILIFSIHQGKAKQSREG